MIKINGEELTFTTFPNGETLVNGIEVQALAYSFLEESKKVAIVTLKYENDTDLIRLMFVKKHLDYNEIPCDLEIAYMPYSRMDRVEGDSVFTLKYVADFINSLNFKKVIIIEPHSDVTPALINNSEEFYPTINLFLYVKGQINFNPNTDYVYFPDAGAEKRYSKKIGNYKQLVGFKKRNFVTGQIEKLEVLGSMTGNPKVIMIDDLCSKGGTFILGANRLKEMGASEIYLVVGHCENTIFEGDLLNTEFVKKIYTTNSILKYSHDKIHVEADFIH